MMRASTGETMATLRELRQQKKWTLTQLESQTGFRVSASTISRIENGGASERRTREDIAVALGVEVDDIDWPKPKGEGGESGD